MPLCEIARVRFVDRQIGRRVDRSWVSGCVVSSIDLSTTRNGNGIRDTGWSIAGNVDRERDDGITRGGGKRVVARALERVTGKS